MASSQPLITIVGPTASGKTSLALTLAERWNGEIICADSRTVYRGMDIGTAKPTKEEQARVRHWGLDLVDPDEQFSAADFKQFATRAIDDIRARGKIPFLVGGTGLYVDSVLYDFSFADAPDKSLRAQLEAMTLSELHSYCRDHSIELPENDRNKRYVIRAIERKSVSGINKSLLPASFYIVGIATKMNTLRMRIEARTEQLFDNDVVGEATILGKKYGWNHESMTGNIYPLVNSYLEKKATLAEIKEKFTTLDYRLAKRQMTWLRRNPDIRWASLTEAESYIDGLLATE
jgi:tRNA dimethylallyltransferase